ncbi:arylsulfatase [Catalinimonas sp. 4WD22]|uniref:arylsulfatase n=1 Tax=Catalinimonas locisalis TaxID=3133978 RepID=UPI003101A234
MKNFLPMLNVLSQSLVLVLLGVVISFTRCTSPQENETSLSKTKPNIIYILADDLGYGDLSCYGQATLSTPRIDQLAKEGMRLNNHYTGATVCAPSRASLLTGLHTGHVSVRANQSGQLLEEHEVTVAEGLKSTGYITGVIGKWGVGHPPPPDDPQRNGFDFAYGYLNMWHAHNFYPEFLYRNGKKEMLKGNQTILVDGKNPWADRPEGTGVAETKTTYTHDLFEKEALSFISDHQDTSFFLYVAFNIPHANNEHPTNGMEVPDYGQFASQDWPEPEKGFASMIQRLDNSVGAIVDKVDQLGLSENTLIIFCSDNGPHQEGFHKMEFFNSNGTLRGMKRDLYEGGVRTPFIARWPGHIEANTQSDHLSAFWDFLPTVCELIEAPIPEDIDGISYLPTLLGDEKSQQQHKYLYWEFYELGGRQSVLKDQWKAVRYNVRDDNPPPTELYNLKNDDSEQQNVAADHPELVSEMELYMDEAHTPLAGFPLFQMTTEAATQ